MSSDFVRNYFHRIQILRWSNDSCWASQEQVNVIVLFFGLQELVALSDELSHKHYLKILNHLASCFPKFWSISKEKVDFFVGLTSQSFCNYAFVDHWVENQDLSVSLRGVCEVVALLVLDFFHAEKGPFVHSFGEFCQVVLGDHQVQLPSKNEVKKIRAVPLVVKRDI